MRNALGESGGAESAKASIDTISHAAQTAAKVATSAFKKIGAVIGGIASGAARAAKGVLGVAKNILTLGSSSRKASGGVNSLFKRLLSLASAAFVFNILRKGLRELSESMRGILMQNKEFVSAWNAIRVNMLTAFAPIWEVLEPAIISFMQLLAQFTSVLAQFMATLFGKSYAQAVASAKALNDQSKALKGVGAAAKAAGKNLQGFDQINRLAAEDAGDSTALDFSAVEPPSPAIIDWLDEFKKKMLDLVPDLDYFYNLGKTLGEKIVAGLQNIPWDSIRAWGVSFIQKFAAFLNGLVDSGLIQQIGTTLAEAFNTALLASFGDGIAVGRRVHKDSRLGVMGKTGTYATGVHLHTEMRQYRLGEDFLLSPFGTNTFKQATAAKWFDPLKVSFTKTSAPDSQKYKTANDVYINADNKAAKNII